MPIKLRSLGRALITLSWFAVCACSRKSEGPNPPRLLNGMGAIHHPVATVKGEAQKFFDQGLAMVYAFNFAEASRSFQRASELDPNSAMPYWGMALASGPNYNAWVVSRDRERAGFDAIQTAAGLAPNAPQPERAYIDALARLFTDAPKPDQSKLGRDYANAMREVYRRYPDDPDAAALFAASLMDLNPWHLWTVDGQPGPDTPEIVAVLEQALRRWPDHTGLNHFYIHTMEASANPERALPSAYRLPMLAPAAAHLLHMPAHIFLRVGDYAAAVKSNEQAIAAPAVAGYSNHNQHYLAVAAGMDGEFEIALQAARELQPHMHNEAMAAMYPLVLMRFARWDGILAAPAPDPEMTGLNFIWHFARGCAFASTRRLPEAANEQAAMERAFSQLPEGRAFGTFFNDWSTLHALAAGELSARISAARGDMADAIAQWRRAAAVQDQMNFDDVPDWYHPIRESLGAALLLDKQVPAAEQAFRDDLARNPRNPRSLFGLIKALEAQHKDYAAAFVRQSFEAAWKGRQQPRLEDF